MFTGIVEEVGWVTQVKPNRLSVRASVVMEDLKLGDSIAVNGVCLTVTERRGNEFSVDLMPETLRRTDLGRLTPGGPVNLERALAFGQRMGGHLVEGHVDATGEVLSVRQEGDALLMEFSAPASLMPYLVEKGFVAVDGASLTVVAVSEGSFLVSLVQYTQEHTVLGSRRVGDAVNLEVDIIAKYVERLTQGRSHP